MELKYDKEADAIYIYFSEKPYAYGTDLDDERRIDYASDNTPIGVELLGVSKGTNLDRLPRIDEIAGVLKANRIRTYTMGESLVDGWVVVFNANFASPATVETEKPSGRPKEEVTACT